MSATTTKLFARSAALALLGTLSACSGGGGSGSSTSFDDQATLLEVRFPDPAGVNPEDETEAPAAAPLVQQVEFVFNGRPDPNRLSRDGLRVRDQAGRPVSGRFVVSDRIVTFTPDLPTRPVVQVSDTEFDTGGTGLAPATSYVVRASPETFSFIAFVEPSFLARFPDPSDPEGIVIPFATTSVAADFFRGLGAQTPRLVDVDPSDGVSNFSPGLYGDPAGLFPARRGMSLRFDGPVHPDPRNLDRFLLVDLEDRPAEFPAGLPLGIDVQVSSNEIDGSTILVSPSGILPFGHMLSLEFPSALSGLGALNPDPGTETTVATTFTVSEAQSTAIQDRLTEDFDTAERQNTDPETIEVGQLFAGWDEMDSDVLEASFAFSGGGILGRFEPAPPEEDTRIVVLDTSLQTFPLLDGSTPEAPPGYVAIGGVFPFTDIDIPAGVEIDVRGPNPLVLSATGSVRIAGRIIASGSRGTDENAFDSAVTSIPGGAARAGGGRGGEGHPIVYFPADVISNRTLVSPTHGGRGFGPGNSGRIGGIGGQSGIHDFPDASGNYGTDSEIHCSELQSSHNNGYKPPGGGGGSMLLAGTAPVQHGEGNVLADGIGGYIVRTRQTDGRNFDRLLKGPPGDSPFSDPDPTNDFIGLRGEIPSVFGGQGGGAGGSAIDGYYCGDWCLIDADPDNDALCQSEFGGNPAFASSVGDSRGGSAGGGGGAVVVMALGSVTFTRTGSIECSGGAGGGGEMLGCGAWSGGGGGGSGGAIVVQSATDIVVRDGARLRVDGGGPGLATAEKTYNGGSCPGTRRDNTPGAGGTGGIGLIQLQLGQGRRATVEDPNNDLTRDAWVDPDNLLNPAPFGSVSVAVSEWYDLGRVITRPPEGTNPIYMFRGLAGDGSVPTDADGNIVDPGALDIRCDYLGQLDPLNPGQYLPGEEPRSDFIPPNASVTVSFQGADAAAEGSKEIDPGSVTPWSPDITDANGKQFVRYRITFDLAADMGTVGASTPRPAVQSITLHADF